MTFNTKQLPSIRDAVAPDGSDVRMLLTLRGGSVAHFELPPGQISVAVSHRTVEEIWYFLSGNGEMWRKLGSQQETVTVEAGISLTIPAGTHFQFRSTGKSPLQAIGVTMPPWHGDGEAFEVEGVWPTTIRRRIT
jgi:mannose-6-phosphate isomerase-like protein (cupin superfamily)